MGIVAWIVFGFVVGLVARAIVPGRQAMGLAMTILLGIAGALVGGMFGSAVWGRPGPGYGFEPRAFVTAVLGAIALLVIGGLVMRPRRRVV